MLPSLHCGWPFAALFYVIALARLLGAATSEPATTLEWTYGLKAGAAAPTLFPNEKQPTGVIVVSGPKVIRLAGDGTVIWESDLEEAGATPATVADLAGDGNTKIVVATTHGRIVCLDDSGQQLWQRSFNTPSGGFKSIAAADVCPHPGLELLLGFNDGWLNCLGADGSCLWRFFGDKFRVSPTAVGDIDNDGGADIVFGTDNGHIYCLSGAGLVKWRYEARAPYGRSGPNLADLNGDGMAEILVTRSNVGNQTCLIALDAHGKRLWKTDDLMQGYVSNATADFDGDGTLEVIHGDKGNHLYCDNADGSRRWQTELGGRGLFWAPAIGDLDGDGRLEIAAAMRGQDPASGASVFLLDDHGQIETRLNVGSGANAGPAIGDIDGDGTLELVLVTQGPNQVRAVSWNGAGRIGWPSLRGNSRMTARADHVAPGSPMLFAAPAEAGQVSVDPGAVTWGENRWQLAWPTPAPRGAYLELSAAAAKGPRRTIIRPVKEGATSAEVRWQLAAAGVTDVCLRMRTSVAAEPLFVAHRQVEPEPPDECQFETVHSSCRRAIATIPSGQAATDGIAARWTALVAARQAVIALADSHGPAQELADQATALRQQAASLHRWADTLQQYWAQGGRGRFVVWQDRNPWDKFDPTDMPGSLDTSPRVQIKVYRNEFEDIALTLCNTTAKTIDVRCMFMPPGSGQTGPPGEPELARRHITLRRAIPVPSAQADAVYDALPELDRSRSITIPAGECRQLWLVVNSHNLAAGTHKLTLSIGSLTKPPTIVKVPVEIQVWPVSLPSDIYAKMNWSRIDSRGESAQTIRDMIQHGIQVVYGPALPTIPIDAKGDVAGPIDWTQFDSAMNRVPGYFTFLWGGPPARGWPQGVRPAAGSPEEFNGFRTAIRELARHLRNLGIVYHQWAFYPVDEPWNTGFSQIPHLKHFCERVKRAEPRVQVYADPAGFVRVQYLKEFKNLVDIWQPEANLLKRDPKLVAWFRKNARRFWFYEASSPGKNFDPLAYYRANAWIAWHFGAEGSGYWLYKGNDIWWPIQGGDWSAVYQTNNQVVPSRRWEADRDGIEDYRALYLLSHEIRQARKRNFAAAADRAEVLIDKATEDLVGWQLRNIDEITRMTREYHLDYNLLMSYRDKIAMEIIRLRGLETR